MYVPQYLDDERLDKAGDLIAVAAQGGAAPVASGLERGGGVGVGLLAHKRHVGRAQVEATGTVLVGIDDLRAILTLVNVVTGSKKKFVRLI